MKIERLGQDKIRIYLTSDDLNERGIQREDMWQEIPRVHELFTEMMDQAYTELGFDATGPLAVEVFALPAQGMVVIVTKGKYDPLHSETGEEEVPDEVYEMEVTMETSDTIVYSFHDIEPLIEAAHLLRERVTEAGTLYHYKDAWVLHFAAEELDDSLHDALIAVLAEFGRASSATTAMLEEYGKKVMADRAVAQICTHFDRRA
ncbi:genetic competence negative regulator [Saccharibacillus sp. CPCC 101409]|uniref:genetic competence negative regulator n=1 Tax=Saccharibacillus sp. CPCC 101409 TaxID=3058041 RepID=UPI002671CA52|nr:genetic competence negative regulator [Saccharibacillus sp. CPCC 101409]MDO3409590.1 genetic competence negative regulator [Saccharibacillus sp. CPCC 101409]